MRVKTLYLRTHGDPQVGIDGESAEVCSDGCLINSEDYDQEEFKAQLEDFRAKMIETFEVIWDERPVALYDFELEDIDSPQD